MTKPKLIIYWARRDLRLQDNPALSASIKVAKSEALPHLTVYILDKNYLDTKQNNVGRSRRFFLSKALDAFLPQFQNYRLFHAKPEEVFEKLSSSFELTVFANDDIEPYAKQRDQDISAILSRNGGSLRLSKDQMSVDPNIRPLSGKSSFYSVFTPFKNAVLDQFVNAPVLSSITNDQLKTLPILQAPILELLEQMKLPVISAEESLFASVFSVLKQTNILYLGGEQISLNIDELIAPDLSGVESFWYFDEKEALRRFDGFLANKILNYRDKRDELGLDTQDGGQTSHMSAALKWGLVSARTLKQRMIDRFGVQNLYSSPGLSHYVSELIWREFYKYTLYQYPEALDMEFNPKFRINIDWIEEPIALDRLRKWILGQTGYAVVDAAMNQIAQIGWMHNRSRMIVASVLSKNLSVDWRWGQEYFRLMLCDMDEAANNGGWQWAASTGTDPKPIRIFNPYLQAENYDKQGLYRRRWLPEEYLQNPPRPIIEHKLARVEALKRYNLEGVKAVRDF